MITIYHNPKCSKSQASLALLESNHVEFVTKEYLLEEITKDELKHVLVMLGLNAFDLIRKGEKLFIEKFQSLNLTNDEWIELMIQNPILIERPIVVKDGSAVIGRPISNVVDLLSR